MNNQQFCTKCGTPITADSSFCPKCGNNIVQVQQSLNVGVAPYPAVQQDFNVIPQMNYPKAGLGSRLLAHIVDSLIACVPMTPGGILMAMGRSTETFGAILLIIAVIWSLFYVFCKDGFAGGQSYGKKMNGLMVINLTTNEPCTKGKSCLRELGMMIPYVGGIIETVMVLANERGRRLGDLLASTQVIEVSQYRR